MIIRATPVETLNHAENFPIKLHVVTFLTGYGLLTIKDV